MINIHHVSNPLDIFVTNDTDRKILNIFIDEVSKVSHRKRKNATLYAVELLRGKDAPKFADALAQALKTIEKSSELS